MSTTDQIRELFIDELEDVQGGAPEPSGPQVMTTMACCEELIFDRCCL